MARIRTIKPEFWTDEKIVQLPFECRLLFIGLWNFADDEGYLCDEPERIRMQIMPGDDLDIPLLLDLLICVGLIERHEIGSDKSALYLPHFIDHQKISHPTKSKIAPEVSGKQTIPVDVRRRVATKYGCKPGGSADAACYCCGMPGRIWWPTNSKGKPGYWVAFSGLEISHFVAEFKGGETTDENMVLCCQHCNRSMQTDTPLDKVSRRIPENSGALRPERKGTEGNGMESNGRDGDPEKPFSVESAFSSLTPSGLSDPERVLAWLVEQQEKGRPVVGNSQAEVINVLAAAHQASNGKAVKNPPAVFASLVSRRKWGDLTAASVDRARGQLRAIEARQRPPPGNGFKAIGIDISKLYMDGTDGDDSAESGDSKAAR